MSNRLCFLSGVCHYSGRHRRMSFCACTCCTADATICTSGGWTLTTASHWQLAHTEIRIDTIAEAACAEREEDLGKGKRSDVQEAENSAENYATECHTCSGSCTQTRKDKDTISRQCTTLLTHVVKDTSQASCCFGLVTSGETSSPLVP
jgi:hypothetical protein